jgi:NitT/TauT family transport system substrate-binding protein
MRKRAAYAIILLSVLSGLAQADLWFGRSATAAETVFRIGFNTWVGYGPFYVAQESGIFKKHNLNVELIRLEGTGERRAALLAKRIDALGSTMDDFVLGLSEGVNGKMVAVLDESKGADGIIAKKGIKSLRDLKGKRIAVQPGFVNHFFLLYMLDQVGIAPNQFQMVPMEPDKAAAALFAGEVDVAVTWEPHLSAIKGKKEFEMITTTADARAQHIIFDTLVIRDDVLTDRKKDVVELIKAWYEALDYIKANADVSNKILAKEFGMPEKEVAETMEGVSFPTLQENIKFMTATTGAAAAPMAKKVIDLYVKAGVMKKAPEAGLLSSSLPVQFLKDATSK